MEWRLEAEKHKAETESLKKQVAALKDALETHRDETRDSILKRYAYVERWQNFGLV